MIIVVYQKDLLEFTGKITNAVDGKGKVGDRSGIAKGNSCLLLYGEKFHVILA
jgi:hypothetical protein